ncbi:PqqD family protein, HPr-rel-A system [Parasphingorhabdus marina DSM 22363]|uniref:PqqD family protein, HPr-rel-A system n=1 Tax=Parasphingorhabdus marina DSM 22363 TaxID=1123272 RepID=A0A1N6F434_9SPHN|nr:HPr-rel-A system PqqD family peptide chaperone [Parasphingorhabdus marina]SIN90025.1 PqqD family protein, HPr-rel-A system [Parasphingorhabdus marina DSM 22363]
MSQQYKLRTGETLIEHVLDSMTAVFQASSGITHLVTDPVPAILEVLSDQFVDSDQVAERLQRQFDLQADADVAAVVAARLEELWQLGLVERRTAP